MERVGEHPVPAGPLAVRWLAYELSEQRSGITTRARVRLENAGTAPWRSRGREGVQLAYHWLDALGNAIVWDGIRAALPQLHEAWAAAGRSGSPTVVPFGVIADRSKLDYFAGLGITEVTVRMPGSGSDEMLRALDELTAFVD